MTKPSKHQEATISPIGTALIEPNLNTKKPAYPPNKTKMLTEAEVQVQQNCDVYSKPPAPLLANICTSRNRQGGVASAVI
jgi:hypothetical protein